MMIVPLFPDLRKAGAIATALLLGIVLFMVTAPAPAAADLAASGTGINAEHDLRGALNHVLHGTLASEEGPACPTLHLCHAVVELPLVALESPASPAPGSTAGRPSDGSLITPFKPPIALDSV